MAGLRRVAKLYGEITINGIKYVWDYAVDEPVLEREMLFGSERWKASERAKFAPCPSPDN